MVVVDTKEAEYPTGPFTIGASGLVVQGDRVLLVRIMYGHRGWMLPGGYVKSNETIGDAIRREMLEETGLLVEPLDLVSVRSRVRDGRSDIYVTFRVKVIGGELRPDGKEIAEARFFTLAEMENRDDVPRLNVEIARQVFEAKKQYFALSDYKPAHDEAYELWL
jgi:8-oxo-dGTP diphosphatase